MSRYVLPALLPQVRAHLPAGKAPDGLVVTADALQLPVVREHIETDWYRSPEPMYAVYAGGEPTEYHTAAAFWRLVHKGVAWFVPKERGASPDADRQPAAPPAPRGGYVLASPC